MDDYLFYLLIFLGSLLLSALATLLVRYFAKRFKIVDDPSGHDNARKIHRQPVPLLGGLAIFVSYFLVIFIFSERFFAGGLSYRHLFFFFLGALLIVLGGALDDRFNLSPSKQIIFPLLAAVSVIVGGVEIVKISNPLGGYIDLSIFPWISRILIFAWLLGMMYTTKLLDGVDGLVSGVSGIGALIIFLFTLSTRYYQPDIAFASLVLAAVCAGFLIFNWNPAKIFLGEGGSLLLGYLLGVLAIISGGKIAIALLVMGMPVLDVVWTIIRRLLKGRNPFRFSDRLHLHHRLLDLGLGQKRTVLIFYFFSFSFGLTGLFLQSRGKLLALFSLVALMLFSIMIFYFFDRRLSKRPKLLLHVCCAPCATYISSHLLLPKYKLSWYFCNPNIETEEEYEIRLRYVRLAADKYGIPLIVEPYRHEEWLEETACFSDDEERGRRCRICYYSRLAATITIADNGDFDYFSSSLLLSPYKDATAIKNISRNLASGSKVNFLEAEEFHAPEINKQSQELAKELGFYRQKYCGCEFSAGQRRKNNI